MAPDAPEPGASALALTEQYREQGYLNLPTLLPPAQVAAVRDAFETLEQQGTIEVGLEDLVEHTDVVFLHQAFADVLRQPAVLELLVAILGPRVELYDSKFINKPLHDLGRTQFGWHQDFAFYPHTNFDLLALAVHLDDEDERSGPLRVIRGSHHGGPRSHCDGGHFLRRVARDPDEADAVMLTGPAGFVTLHHCLTVHSSSPKQRPVNRRILYYDIRAQDNVQLAGYLRRSAGYEVTTRPPDESRYARFHDGTRLELRGASGQLYDAFGRLAAGVATPERP